MQDVGGRGGVHRGIWWGNLREVGRPRMDIDHSQVRNVIFILRKIFKKSI
jgi:hypothetical protein